MITSLLLMITNRMHWYILEVLDLGEIFVSALHCLIVLFIIVIVCQSIPSHQGIASYYKSLPGSRHAAN